MSGYVFGAEGGDAYDRHGARIVVKASGGDTAATGTPVPPPNAGVSPA